MDDLRFYKNQNFIDYCTGYLQSLVKETQGVNVAVLATIDGFTITSLSPNNDHEMIERLSAVGSSLLALSTSVVDELGLKQCQALEIHTDKGHIWVSIIEVQGKILMFLIQTNDQILQGELIFHARRIKQHIECYTQ